MAVFCDVSSMEERNFRVFSGCVRTAGPKNALRIPHLSSCVSVLSHAQYYVSCYHSLLAALGFCRLCYRKRVVLHCSMV